MTELKIWEQRVAAWRSSGQSARRFAEGREFSVHMLRYWARRVDATPPARAAGTAPAAPREELRIARVIRPAVAAVPREGRSEPAVAIELGGAVITVKAGFDQATLAAVLDVLGLRHRS